MGNTCGCCGAREKGPEKRPETGPAALPEDASGGAKDYGFALAKNDRKRMEDAVAVNEDVAGYKLFAVFDGHGGDKATKLAQQLLPEQLHQHLQQAGCKKKAGSDAFTALDDRLCSMLLEEEKMPMPDTSSGTVVCAALLKDRELLVLNAGDCRLVASEGGTAAAYTTDHSPEKNEQERKRLETLGVCVDGGYVDGQIQVSRALGNISKTGKKVPGIICTPDVSVVSIQDTTEFVLLATDGVWDAIREQLAVTTARKVLRETRSPEAAAKAVLEAAGKASKADNSAVIVLSFNMPEPLPKRDSEQRRFQFSSKKE